MILLIGDIVLLFTSLWLTLLVGFWGTINVQLFFEHALPFSFLYVFWLVVFYAMDLYDLSLPPTSSSFITRYGVALVVLFGTGILFFYATTLTNLTPKTNLFTHVLLFGTLAYGWRFLFFKKISSLAPWRIGLLNLEDQGRELKDIIRSLKHHGYESFILSSEEESLAQQIERHSLDVVILPPVFLRQGDHIQTLYTCLGTGVTFLDLAQAYEVFARRIPLSVIDHQWFIRNIQEQERGLYARVKRFVDLVIATMALCVTLPLWGVIALVIKVEDRGSVFYSQERIGKHGRPFFIHKFRTMRSDAEKTGAQWAQKSDTRITRVGRLLRWSHLDELPQLVNVLRGDLSLVGPRPERSIFVDTLEREIPHYQLRHIVKPGVTGWAQIKFRYARSVEDSQKKFEYDLYYMKNRSLVFDVMILLKTFQMLCRREQ